MKVRPDAQQTLEKASKAYYEGSPIMTDEEFDALAVANGWSTVGYANLEGERVPHTYRMYSLQKHIQGSGETPPLANIGKDSIVVTSKLDGASIALTYEGGELVQVLTRGDGKEGIDITNKFLNPTCYLAPRKINTQQLLQITGEIVSPKTIPNARNYAAGALNLKDVREFLSRNLSFVVHGVSPSLTDTYCNDMEKLRGEGFRNVLQSNYSEFPHDGTVWRIDCNKTYSKMGHTAHHPRGAYALKVQKEAVNTTLLDVVWQVGKSGVVSPVAILDTVEIEGAMISRATLHNIAYIKDLGLEIGCEVQVIRSGDIIPRIIGRT
jgi:DNA ligase (NAD+)